MPFIRSFLFVPAANERLLHSALGKGSDCVILDLEDGTHPSQKAVARQGLASALKSVKGTGKVAAVRINGGMLNSAVDLRAAVCADLDLLLIPKVEHPRDLQLLDEAVTSLESEGNLQIGHIKFLVQIESAVALPRLHDIATATPRVMGMMLGSEDFSLDCGSMPTPDALYVPSMMVLHAARAAKIQAIGFIASIADLGTPESFQSVIQRARELGFRGAVIVHPKFIEVVNACFTPTADQIAHAKQMVEAFEAADAQGLGAIRVNDLMVDKPVYRRALELLSESRPA
jgi:citrate lyase subunit beta/citryl-CoA lyase